MKYRNDYHKNSQVIRVPLGTYAALKQIAVEAQVSIGQVVEALAKLESVKKQPEIQKAQIPLPVFPAIAYKPSSAKVDSVTAIGIKSKGVKIE
jgi:hypothetical protein